MLNPANRLIFALEQLLTKVHDEANQDNTAYFFSLMDLISYPEGQLNPSPEAAFLYQAFSANGLHIKWFSISPVYNSYAQRWLMQQQENKALVEYSGAMFANSPGTSAQSPQCTESGKT